MFWAYGVLGSVLVSACGLLVPADSRWGYRGYAVFGVLYSAYWTIGTYQCAGNCRSRGLAVFVRVSAVLSLLLLPVFAYLDLSGALDRAVLGLVGGP